jgi:hypothetical protein
MRPLVHAVVHRAALGLWLGIAGLLSATAAELAPTVPLEWRVASNAFNDILLYEGQGARAFTPAKSPISKNALFCRTLRLGKRMVNVGLDKPSGGLSRANSACVLYVDVNQNGDLTDGPTGVYRAVSQEEGPTFTNVTLPFSSPTTNGWLVADLVFLPYNIKLCPKSYYSAQVSLGGRDYEAGLLIEPAQWKAETITRLLLRPWQERNRPFVSGMEIPEAFPLPSRLFLNGQLYAISTLSENGKLALQWTPLPSPPTGDLQLTGAGAYRLVLLGMDTTVMLDTPGATAKVPTGHYTQKTVWLRSEKSAAVNNARPGAFEILPHRPYSIPAGGPLTNLVVLGRRGNTLTLNYKLVGTGGEAFTLYPQDRAKPPQFKILRQQRQVLAGKFEYG